MALATVDDLEAVAGSVADLDRASRLLEMASSVVERWCSRRFAYVEDDARTIRVTDGTMWLPDGPVSSVTSVVNPYGNAIVDGGWTLVGAELRRSYGVHGYWAWWECGEYTVTYSHGFDPIPEDVVLAVCQIAARQIAVDNTGLTQKTVGPFSETYRDDIGAGLHVGPERDLLVPYRRTVGSVRVTR